MSKIPSMQVGRYTKYKNNDGSMSIYREGVFVSAIEDTTASCDLVYKMATEISKVELELNRAYAIIEIFEKALKEISEKVKMNTPPHWLTIHDELVFYCPILDNIWIYTVQFWKDNRGLFDTNGLVYLGEL
jgi:hypothetical protein